jgi:hypothetical protein
MKKIVVLMILLIVGASVFASGQNEPQKSSVFKNSIEDFQGTWQQVNGSSVITITGNDFTLLNMEIGYAGYGIVSMGYWNKNNVKTEAIRFDFHNDYEGRSTKGFYFYLGMTEDYLNKVKRDKNILVNDFQMKAWEEFSSISEKNDRFSDDIIKKYFDIPAYKKLNYPTPSGGTGGSAFFFELNGDNLKLFDIHKEKEINSDISFYLWNLLFCGEFVRVK